MDDSRGVVVNATILILLAALLAVVGLPVLAIWYLYGKCEPRRIA